MMQSNPCRSLIRAAAGLAPTGMIFVPSGGGISHSPREETRVRDLINSTEIPLLSLLNIDGIGL